MKKILNVRNEDIPYLARLPRSTEVAPLIRMVQEADIEVGKLWKKATGEGLNQLQGIGQLLDELKDVFEKGDDWMNNLKQENKG